MHYRLCAKCTLEKSIDNFSFIKNRNTYDYYCKPCRSNITKDYRNSNLKKITSSEKIRKDLNREKIKVTDKLYFENNKVKIKESLDKYKLNNKEKIKLSLDKYRLANKKIIAERASNNRKKSPELFAAYKAKRRASKITATPNWANNFFINEIYHLAKLREFHTGIKWHVDHIIPLANKLVCGLHVEQNLQVIPAIINLRKHNKFIIA